MILGELISLWQAHDATLGWQTRFRESDIAGKAGGFSVMKDQNDETNDRLFCSDAIKISDTAAFLRDLPGDEEALAFACEHIEAGLGGSLFDGIIEAFKSDSSEAHPIVPLVMRMLEAAMDVNPKVAGYLMGRLYPLASRKRHHEVCDAIDLWMYNTTSVEVADGLRLLVAEPMRPQLRERCIRWVVEIARKIR
jgi:hypothetical protein